MRCRARYGRDSLVVGRKASNSLVAHRGPYTNRSDMASVIVVSAIHPSDFHATMMNGDVTHRPMSRDTHMPANSGHQIIFFDIFGALGGFGTCNFGAFGTKCAPVIAW